MPQTRPPRPAPGRDVPHRLAPDEQFDIAAHDTDDTAGLDKAQAEERLGELLSRLNDLQDKFRAEESRSLLVVLQGFDGAGKDVMITNVLSAFDPSMLHVYDFNKPVGDEAAHDFLWRFHQHTPALGAVHVFDRSHYEEVVSTRVHDLIDRETCEERYQSINDWERILVRDGTVIVKVFLHVSKDKQAERVQERLNELPRHHEFSAADVEDRELWDDYDRAYEEAINATNTDFAPWHPVPADHRWYSKVVVADILVRVLEDLDPQYPPLDREELEEAGIDPSDVGASA
jgi:PPK2 family polyphosphate:nucleotide phosphotransferase